MARTIAQIKQSMLDAKAADSNLAGLTSTSQTAKWNLYFFIVASCIAIFEQLQDLFKKDLETIAYNTPPNTPQWTRQKVFKFQTTDVAELNTTTYVVEYPIINTANQIITCCSVNTTTNHTVQIKVAQGTYPFSPLSSPEKTEVEDYVKQWIPAGISYTIISTDSDKIEIVADIYYDGQYTSVISANVIAALENYFSNLPFDGTVSNQAIIDAMQAVQGVNYVRLSKVLCRKDIQSYGTGVTLYDLSTGTDAVKYLTYAGYIEEETTSGHTFTDTLNFIVS